MTYHLSAKRTQCGGEAEELGGSAWPAGQHRRLTLSELIGTRVCSEADSSPTPCLRRGFVPAPGTLSLLLMSFRWNVAFERPALGKMGH